MRQMQDAEHSLHPVSTHVFLVSQDLYCRPLFKGTHCPIEPIAALQYAAGALAPVAARTVLAGLQEAGVVCISLDETHVVVKPGEVACEKARQQTRWGYESLCSLPKK